ncbi:MAG: RNA polymerase sigma factor [Planctomycetes bacterium]|nr:RNA polymerase sigma factor [Planctomycetota bacterium]
MTQATTESADLDLLARVRDARDAEAFAALLTRHHVAAYSLACHLLGNRERAEDAFQEACLRAWRFANTHRGEGSVRSWFLRIVARECLRHLKRERRKAVSMDDANIESAVDSARLPERAQPEDQAVSTEQSEALRRCLERLPTLHRRVVALYYGAGLDQKEIGAELEISQQAVSNKLQDALARLRTLLSGAGIAAATPLLQGERLAELMQSGQQPPASLTHALFAERSWASPHAKLAGESLRHSRRAAGIAGASGTWAALVVILAAATAGGIFAMRTLLPEESTQYTPAAAPAPAPPAPPRPAEPEPIRLEWDFTKGGMDGIEVVAGTLRYRVADGRGRAEIPQGEQAVWRFPPVPAERAYRVTADWRNSIRGTFLVGAGVSKDGFRTPMRSYLLIPSPGAYVDKKYTTEWYFFGRFMLMYQDGKLYQFSEYKKAHAGEIALFMNGFRTSYDRLLIESLREDEVEPLRAEAQRLMAANPHPDEYTREGQRLWDLSYVPVPKENQ